MEAEVKEIRRVRLGPEDRLVVNFDHSPTQAEVERIRADVQGAFGVDRDHLILVAGGVDWSVVGPEPPERAALEELLALILDEMPGATNRDLACDGPVGDEEEGVWARIEARAQKAREELFS